MACCALVVAACGDDQAATSTERPTGGVTVFAASSLEAAFRTIGDAFEAANPGSTVTFQFAGSDRLATQIREGAPADVYAAASEKYPIELAGEGLVGEPLGFASNTLTLAIPTANPGGIVDASSIAAPGTKVVLGAEGVPIGDATRKVLGLLGEVYGNQFTGKVVSNVVSEEQDVKGIVAKLETGEADAGFIYVTDVAASSGLTAITLPEGAMLTVSYPIAVVRASRNADVAARFVEFVRGVDGQAALAAVGFGPITP